MSATSEPMASNEQHSDVFNFFGLPRELRDLIYAELLVTCNFEIAEDELRASAERATATNLLLVSRQFGHEYQSHSESTVQLIIRDHIENVCEVPCDITVPEKLVSCRKVHFDLSLNAPEKCHLGGGRDCENQAEIEMHSKWIRSVQRIMSHATTITVDIHMRQAVWKGEQTDAAYKHLSDMAGVLHFESLRIRIFRAPECTYWDYAEREGLLAE